MKWVLVIVTLFAVPTIGSADKNGVTATNGVAVTNGVAKSANDLDQSCFVARDLQTGKVISEQNPEFCKTRVYPCSSFKVAAAAMSFDSGVAKDENTSFKWDGIKREREELNHDQTTRSWLADSVLWVTQQVMTKLGLEKVKSYLIDFRYGNQDFGSGLTESWVSSSLKISPEEQVDFLSRLKRGKLNLTPYAVQKTLSVIPVGQDDASGKIIGKTGSCLPWLDGVPSGRDSSLKGSEPFWLGYYVGYYFKDGKEYAFAADVKKKTEPRKWTWGGREAQKFAVEQLKALK
jgi:beta-lactamase class D